MNTDPIYNSQPTPSYKDFIALLNRVDKLEEELPFLRSLLLNQRWLTRLQTIDAIGCSKGTLKKLTDMNKLTHRYEGKKPFYDVHSVRAYLSRRQVDAKIVDQRVLRAIHTTNHKSSDS